MSKKRSAANSSSKPPSRYAFFIDRSLGRKIVAGALRQAGAEVHVHDDYFRPNARDEEWLRVVGQRGWIVLTKDKRIRYRGTELAALVNAGVRAFVLTGRNLQGSEMGKIFVRALPAINRFAERHPAPFIAKLTPGGAVSMVFSGA